MTSSEYPDSEGDWALGGTKSLDEVMQGLGSLPEKSRGIVVDPPTEREVATYERLVPMLVAAHREMGELSKKKPDGIVNALKIRNINRLLNELQKLLIGDPSRDYVELLEEDALPQNGDVVLLLSQWHAALAQYKNRYCKPEAKGMYQWITVENPGLYTIRERAEVIPGFRSSGVVILHVIGVDGGQNVVSVQVNTVPVTTEDHGGIETVVRTAIGTFKDHPATMKKAEIIDALRYAVEKLEARES